MTIDQFLLYWSRHNTVIIEVLIAVILLTVIYLAFRAFFAGRNSESSASFEGGLNTEQLEKTLQKILDSQQTAKPKELSPLELMEMGPTQNAEVAQTKAELEKVKADLVQKEKAIEQLKAKVASAPAAGTTGAASGANDGRSKELEAKIKDLEARLSEYEIISEDIADLSFFKEENTKLQKELAALKGGAPQVSTPPPATAPESATPEASSAPASAAPAAVAASTESAGEKPSLADQLFAAAETVPVTSTTPPEKTESFMVSGGDGKPVDNQETIKATSAPPVASGGETAASSESGLDDDLMKEFAAAVEGQKKAGQTPGADAAEETPNIKFPIEENKQLMKEFEDFTSKKGQS